ncbi:MAG TPA: NPCBM/NEW2 domain-containing protein [Vicinamibacterales bacterium]|jgi:hypothetical protein
MPDALFPDLDARPAERPTETFAGMPSESRPKRDEVPGEAASTRMAGPSVRTRPIALEEAHAPDHLASLETKAATDVGREAMGGGALLAAGKRYEAVVPARAGNDVEYDVKGLYNGVVAEAAVDDGFEGSLRFVVIGDGRELWASDSLSKGSTPIPVRVSIAGVKRLVLRATAVGRTPAGDRGTEGTSMRMGAQAGWIGARLNGPVNTR